MISQDTVLRHKPGITFQDTGSELFVRGQEGSQVHVLNSTAKEIFLLIDGQISLERVVEEFESTYHRDLRDDVLTLATTLVNKELLEETPG